MTLSGRRLNLAIGLAALLAPQVTYAGQDLGRVQVEPLAVTDSSPIWPSPQFFQADHQGRVFLLRADTLQVFQVGPGDRLLSRGKLEATAAAESSEPPVIRQATMSSAGDIWFLLDSDHQVRLFRGGKEKYLPQTDWIASGLAVSRNNPLVAVEPVQLANGKDPMLAVDPKHPPQPPPFLLQLGESRWETLVQGSFFEVGDTRASIGREIRAGSEVWMATEPNGTLWVAYRNSYRLQRYSPLGRLKDQIKVGEGQVKWAERTPEDWKRLEAVAKDNKFAFKRSGVSPVQETAVIRAMTLATDGRLYLLVETPKGLALDRFDPNPAHQGIERVALSGLGSGRYSMAAGRDGLYLAALLGNAGRWRLPWERLETAKWKPVDEVVINGEPVRVASSPGSGH